MEEETTDQLTRFMDNLNSAMEGGADFILEQAPLVIQEIVIWGRIEHTAWVVLSMAMMTAAVLFLKKKVMPYCAAVEDAPYGNNQEFCYVASFLVFAIVMVICATTFAINLTPCLKAWFAPRLYVIEYIADALR